MKTPRSKKKVYKYNARMRILKTEHGQKLPNVALTTAQPKMGTRNKTTQSAQNKMAKPQEIKNFRTTKRKKDKIDNSIENA